MSLLAKYEEVKQQIKNEITRSENVKLRVTPVIFARLKETSKALHVSRNELINFILDEVLI